MEFSRVLIVEDHPDNMDIYRTILEHYGFTVLSAMDGAQGVSMAREHVPDIVVMDITLPVMDGYEAASIIKQDPSLCHVPVIALTARSPIFELDQSKLEIFDSYLLKPIEPSSVVMEIKRFLGVEQEKL